MEKYLFFYTRLFLLLIKIQEDVVIASSILLSGMSLLCHNIVMYYSAMLFSKI